MDRTLYLNENKGLRVYWDGPSIWIREEGKAGRRIPVRLIGRVFIIGNISLDAGTITLFAENDVPVTFLSRKGESLAVVMPYIQELPRYYERQKALLITDDRINGFKDWIYARRRWMQIYVVKRLSKKRSRIFLEKGFREKDYRNFIEEMKPVSAGAWKAAYGVISNMFRELVIGSIVKADLDVHLGVLHRRYNFGLALDICHIIEPEFDLQCIQFMRSARQKGYIIEEQKTWSVSQEGMRDIVHRFENKKAWLQKAVERLLDNIFELMRMLRQ